MVVIDAHMHINLVISHPNKKVIPKRRDNLVLLRRTVNSVKPENFFETIKGLANGTIIPVPQKKSDGIHHRPMTKEEFEEAEKKPQKITSELQ